MTLTPIEIAAYIAAGTLAASKLITAFQPLWNKLPRWLSVALPVVVADAPQVVSAFSGVHVGADLTQAAITTVALLLPGIAEAEVPAKPVA